MPGELPSLLLGAVRCQGAGVPGYAWAGSDLCQVLPLMHWVGQCHERPCSAVNVLRLSPLRL